MSKRPYDVVVWGCTGFTGRLAADYIVKRYGMPSLESKKLTWALAARNRQKLEELRSQLVHKHGIDADGIDIIVADIDNEQSLDKMTSQTKVLISTAGPFALIGTPIVASCVRNGCNYVDITGEPQWVRKMIDLYHSEAERKKLKIVPCCGFDCIPVDLGCNFMVEEMKKRNLVPKEVRTTLVKAVGGASGGTINSIVNVFTTSTLRDMLELLDPYYLTPRDKFGKPSRPSAATCKAASDKNMFSYDSSLKKYVVPFVMQSIDTRVVNRSNAIGGTDPNSWKYGKEFVYTEDATVPNLLVAVLAVLATPVGMLLMYFSFTRRILSRFLPAAGEGPDEKTRDNGFFAFRSMGKGLNTSTGTLETITGKFDAPNGDGGYKQTSAMVVEAALCLALDTNTPTQYGVLTPSTAFGQAIVNRLEESPGITFRIDQ